MKKDRNGVRLPASLEPGVLRAGALDLQGFVGMTFCTLTAHHLPGSENSHHVRGSLICQELLHHDGVLVTPFSSDRELTQVAPAALFLWHFPRPLTEAWLG